MNQDKKAGKSVKEVTKKKKAKRDTAANQQHNNRSAKSSEKDVPTPALVCQDGRMVELALDPKTGQAGFIVFRPRRDKWIRTGKVTDGSKVYVPLRGADQICTIGFGLSGGAVLLPTEPVDYGSEEELIEEIRYFIHSYVQLDTNYEVIGTHYVVFTWLFDRFDEVAYLRFFAHDIRVGKSRALETIGSISYRPIFLAGASTSAALRRIVDSYRGTIVADEQDRKGAHDLTTDYIKILNQGFQRGRPVIVCNMGSDNREPQTFDVFGPKVVVTRRRFNDDALESRFLTIKMHPKTRTDLPLNLPRQEFDERALSLRNKLLKYRFDNYHKVKLNTSHIIDGVTDRLNQIGIPLLSTIHSAGAQKKVIRSLKSAHKELVESWSNSMAGTIAQYLCEEWRTSQAPVYVKRIFAYLNYRELQGEQISAKKVGLIVRDQLGLKTKHTRDGNVVLWNKTRMAELTRKYSAPGD